MDSSKKNRRKSGTEPHAGRDLLLAAVALCALTPQALAETEEQRIIRLARMLKPISDSAWQEIAGSHVAESYELQQGDTLWDVSKKLFGNAYYWPKIWSLNAGIRNPHVVAPGQKLSFTPGSSEVMPRLAPAADPFVTRKSQSSVAEGPAEYLKLDPDKWKPIDVKKANSSIYDETGFEREAAISFKERFAFRVPSIANDATIPFLGEIVGSRREGSGLSQHETVFLRSPTQDLQIGTTYSILTDPQYEREGKSDRSAYVYRATAEVKVIGVKDELYVGIITSANDVVKRGDRLYPLLPMISGIKPIASGSGIEALVVDTMNMPNAGQYAFVHFDRGIEDGVQIGNVFRIYQYYDPATRAKLTDSDFLIHADAIVIHATAQFCTALVLNSRSTFGRGDFGVLMTDVSELDKKRRAKDHDIGEGPAEQPGDRELDELDSLDRESGDGIGKNEETEIKELDQWDRTKDMQNDPHAEPALSAPADQPTDEIEQNPVLEPETPAQEPTLDQTLDSPSATPYQDVAPTEPATPPEPVNPAPADSPEALAVPPMPAIE